MELSALLALDIGGGTQDILLWRADQDMENAVKLVLPSPTQVVAARLREAGQKGQPVFLTGWLMGGGAMHQAVSEHLAQGLAVYATEGAAASLADDLERVRAQGVRIVDEAPPQAVTISTTDLDLEALGQALGLFQVELPSQLAVAVCDHGYSPGFSNRKFRFQMWERFLAQGGHLGGLIFSQAPAGMTRMKAIKDQSPSCLLMDTAAAAAWGALQDPAVSLMAKEGVCLVNLGNMHTVAFLIQGQRVLGIYEHHTGCLTTDSLVRQIRRFQNGDLSNQEVFDSQGHGCARLPRAPRHDSWPVVITGPQRRLARGLGWRTAVPHGDVMLSGCFGLLAAAQARAGLGL